MKHFLLAVALGFTSASASAMDDQSAAMVEAKRDSLEVLFGQMRLVILGDTNLARSKDILAKHSMSDSNRSVIASWLEFAQTNNFKSFSTTINKKSGSEKAQLLGILNAGMKILKSGLRR